MLQVSLMDQSSMSALEAANVQVRHDLSASVTMAAIVKARSPKLESLVRDGLGTWDVVVLHDAELGFVVLGAPQDMLDAGVSIWSEARCSTDDIARAVEAYLMPLEVSFIRA